jgi:hypothetical protein
LATECILVKIRLSADADEKISPVFMLALKQTMLVSVRKGV